MSQNDPKRPQLKVSLDDAVAQGKYANLALISHTESEFVFDFIFVQPGQTQAKVNSRIIVNPRQAKRFVATLAGALQQYEARFGPITPANEPGTVH